MIGEGKRVMRCAQPFLFRFRAETRGQGVSKKDFGEPSGACCSTTIWP